MGRWFWDVGGMNEPAWRQHTRPARAWLSAPATAPAATTSSDAVVAWGAAWSSA